MILIVGIAVRFIGIVSIPDGLNQDEAYAAYEAYSILHYGTDSWGYTLPVYLTTWGSGMSIMNAYLMIPFIALMGTSVLAVRLPQVILGVITLIYFYKLFKLIFPDNRKAAIVALFVLAINPWHILMCRWALDCNMAPGFCLIAFYYFCKGVERPKFFILSAIFYGLTLYCYALTWVLVPIILLLQIAYLLIVKKIHSDKYILFSLFILLIMGLPLILFNLVNSGRIPEIRTALFSIPKMPLYRSSEVGIGHRKERLIGFISSVIGQDDGCIWNYAGKYGLYYGIGLVLSAIGAISVFVKGIKSILSRRYSPEVMILIPIPICVVLASLMDATFSKMNFIHLPIIAFGVIGIETLVHFVRNNKVLACIYGIGALGGFILFASFEKYYFGEYRELIAGNFKSGFSACLEYSESIRTDERIYVNDYSSHPVVLFYEHVPVSDEGLVKCRNEGIAASSFSHYAFDPEEALEGDICILCTSYLPGWYSEDMALFTDGVYVVCRK